MSATALQSLATEMQKPTVLLVDDEPDALEAISVGLEDTFNVLCVRSGEEALEVLRDASVSLIVADQRMNGMSGVDLFVRVRALYPSAARVLLTAYADFDALVRACNEGQIHRYVPKPCGLDEMRQAFLMAIAEHGPALEPVKLNRSVAPSEAPALLPEYAKPQSVDPPPPVFDDDNTSELKYPPIREGIDADAYAREAANGHMRWVVIGAVCAVGGFTFMSWALFMLATGLLP